MAEVSSATPQGILAGGKLGGASTLTPAFDEDGGGFYQLQFPDSEGDWIQQASVLAGALRDLHANCRILIKSKSKEPDWLRQIQNKLDKLRVQYVAWAGSVDPEAGARLVDDQRTFDIVIQSIDTIRSSLDALNTLFRHLKDSAFLEAWIDAEPMLMRSRAEPRDAEEIEREPSNLDAETEKLLVKKEDTVDSIQDELDDIDSALQNLQDSTFRYLYAYVFPDRPATATEFSNHLAMLKAEGSNARAKAPKKLAEPPSVEPVDLTRYSCDMCDHSSESQLQLRLHKLQHYAWIWGPAAFFFSILQFALLIRELPTAPDPNVSAEVDQTSGGPPQDRLRPWKTGTVATQWSSAYQARSFQIPVLGVLLLLGQKQMNYKLGRLVSSGYLEYLPILGSIVLAGNEITERQVGYQLYNITNGISTADLAGWLTRWLRSQDFEPHRTCIIWNVSPASNELSPPGNTSFVIIAALVGILVGLAERDLASPASIVFMVTEILTRQYILRANRAAVDKAVDNIARKNWDEVGPDVKALVLMPNGKAVTMKFPVDLEKLFFKDPKPADPLAYQMVRYVSWIAFAGHLVCLSMAQLPVQLVSLPLLLLGTISTYWKLGCDDSPITPYKSRPAEGKVAGAQEVFSCRIGSRLTAVVTQWNLQEVGWRPSEEPNRHARRQDVYAWLDLKNHEEKYMDRWNLFPLGQDQQSWHDQYQKKKRERQAWIRKS